MDHSDSHLLHLPDELLLIILKKLNNIDVLYSLIDGDNDRLDVIAQDKSFTTNLNLISSNNISIDEMILSRLCSHVLPRIHHHIQHLTVECSLISRIFLLGSYPKLATLKLFKFGHNVSSQCFQDQSLAADIFKQQITDLTLIYHDSDGIITALKDYTTNVYAHILTFFKHLEHLSIHGSSIDAHPGLILNGLPSNTFSSSILSKLCISVCTLDDCLSLLDGRLSQLTSLVVRVYSINAPLSIVHNNDSLVKLKCFSLTCHSHISTYDNRVVPLLRCMSNLQDLTLCLTVRNRSGLIDGTHFRNEILLHMPFLSTFTFDIRTWNVIDGLPQSLSNEDIQRTFTEIVYGQVACSIRYFETNSVLCHVFSLPFTFDYLQCLTSNFPNVSFDYVVYLSICDTLPFEHEFFTRLAQAFPLLRHLTVTNSTSQTYKLLEENDSSQSYSITEYKCLTYLSVMNSDVTYTEQFLIETKTHLPVLTELRVNYEHLKNVTESFTRDATRINCTNVKRLITETTVSHSDDFSLYFPLL